VKAVDSFPSNQIEALAFLYVQNQDLSKMTPEEIAVMYNDAHEKIKSKVNELHRAQYRSRGSSPVF